MTSQGEGEVAGEALTDKCVTWGGGEGTKMGHEPESHVCLAWLGMQECRR